MLVGAKYCIFYLKNEHQFLLLNIILHIHIGTVTVSSPKFVNVHIIGLLSLDALTKHGLRMLKLKMSWNT